MTFRQAVGVVLLGIAGQVGVQQAGGPAAQPGPAPLPAPAPIANATPPGLTHQFPLMSRNIPAPGPTAPDRPSVVAPSVEWYTAAARREYERLNPR